jgi:hypothetical protein
VIDRAVSFSSCRFCLVQHLVERLGFDAEGDMQIQRILALELERCARHLEKGQARPIVHLEKSVQRAPAARRGPADLERADKAKAEEILVEAAGLL